MRTTLIASGLPMTLWGELYKMGCHLYNNWPHSALNEATPASVFFPEGDSRRKFELAHVYPAGCSVHMLIPKEKRNKMQPRAIQGWYVGVAVDEPGVRIWVPTQNTVLSSSSVTVWPDKRYTATEIQKTPIPASRDQGQEYVVDRILDERIRGGKREFLVRWKDYDNPEDDSWEPLRNMSDTIALDKWESPCQDTICASLASANPDVPLTARQALSGRDHEKWWDAMVSEYEAIAEQGTWELVTRPANRKIISAKWVLRVKWNNEHTVPTFKARLCARGFTQVPGLDYDATYAPTVSRAALRIVIALSVQLKLLLHVVDCKNAFLNGDIDKEIFIEQPPYFVAPGTSSRSHVCKLKKALYGLKQSPLIWNMALHSALISGGFERMEYELCVYVYRSRGGYSGNLKKDSRGSSTPKPYDFDRDHMFCILAVYVDDITIAARSEQALAFAKKAISNAFATKDLGEAKKIIGIELQKVPNGLILHQSQYLREVLERFSMHNANGLSCPMDPNSKLCQRAESEEKYDNSLYRQQISALLFASTCTRPDMSVAINICARFVEDPCQRHAGAVKRIMRYAKQSLDHGLKYVHDGKPLTVTAFCDSDFAGDVRDSRSTSGYVVLVNGCVVSWRTTKQKCVSTSTVEAEYISASTACKEVMWITRLMEEILGKTLGECPVMFMDNTGALSLAQNDAMSEKTKHIRYTYHFVRECAKEGIVDLRHVSTHENPADMMTKPLARILLERHCNAINIASKSSCGK